MIVFRAASARSSASPLSSISLSSLLLFLLCFSPSNWFTPTFLISAQPYDAILKQNVDHVFVSVGFTYIDDSQWFTLTTLANQFVKDTILLVTIPQVNGTYPAVVKMQNPTTLNADKTVTFTIRIVQPNDSFCSKQFYIPEYIDPPLQVAWMVFEIGSYVVKGSQFIAGKGAMTRASWSTSATFTNGNLIAIWFPTGCVSSTEFCALSATNRGGINLLQTNNNVKEAGKVLYLSVRAKIIDARRGQWVLVPHDVASTVTTYHVLAEETLGYLAFPVGIKIECFEKMIWETIVQTGVNYIERTVTYQQTYDYPPGLFGIVGTIISLCDTILKSSNWQVTQGTFAINEDQCVKQEIRHTTEETVYLVVVGEKQTTTSNYSCYVNFNSALNPTTSPTTFPTFKPSSPPTRFPTFVPSVSPTRAPTSQPTVAPTRAPTTAPTTAPTAAPTAAPTRAPTTQPTTAPTAAPTTQPTFLPTSTTASPTVKPTSAPSSAPTSSPTFAPTASPTSKPSSSPTSAPTSAPTFAPTSAPTATPSAFPTSSPTFAPTAKPSSPPTSSPTVVPTAIPSTSPTANPSSAPSSPPTLFPTAKPSTSPTVQPSSHPTIAPTANPTIRPTTPTVSPTISPTFQPTKTCTSSFPVKIKKVLP